MAAAECPEVLDSLVIGAGQAGLAMAYHLRQHHLNFLVLEASDRPVGSWPLHYDSLRLFSPAKHAALPGLPFPGDPEHYPTRDEVVRYLSNYAARFSFPIRTGSLVTHVEKEGDLFLAHTADGRQYAARTLIAATGTFRKPFSPALPGQKNFKGVVLHSLQYQIPQDFQGQRVVVVGAGNSAVQIAVELAQVARVTLATRRPVRFLPQRLLGRDIHDWLSWLKLDQLPLGWLRRVPPSTRVLDGGRYRKAIASGQPDERRMFHSFTTAGVRWPDGQEEPIDTVIFATGYRPNLDFLHIPSALNPSEEPDQKAGISQTIPGLYFVGLAGQRANASATLRGASLDAQIVVRHLARHHLPRSAPVKPTFFLSCC